MKNKILIASIYLLGCVANYPFLRFTVKTGENRTEWSKGDRMTAIALSSFSWISVAATGITYLTIVANNNNEKADW